MDFAKENVRVLLLDLIEAAAPMLLPETQEKVVECLMSPEVDATDPTLFKCVTLEDIPLTLVGAAPRRAIIKALSEYDPGQNRLPAQAAPPPSKKTKRSVPERIPLSERNINVRSVAELSTYTFKIDWKKLDQMLITRMMEANEEKREANNKDKELLKNQLALLMKSSYESHCALFPQKFKTPGISYYRSVRDEVFEKFSFCLSDFILDEVVGDGRETWLKSFRLCVENKMRDNECFDKQQRKAVVAAGLVEARPADYHPPVSPAERPALEEKRDKLAKMSKRKRSEWNLSAIQRDMHTTYGLQRDDIIVAKADPDTQVARIKESWPFLFKQPWLGVHFQLLTGQIVDQALYGWKASHSETFLLYLCSSPSPHVKEETPVRNIAEKKKWESCGENSNLTLLLVLKLASNYFNEADGFKEFLLTKEKTTLMHEVEEELTAKYPQIVAMDTNMYLAERFLVCMGKVVLQESISYDEAMVYYLHLIFTFDTHYPANLQATMEFFERVVFFLGKDTTRLNSKKATKEIYVLTPNVAKLINKVKAFKEELKKFLEEE